MAPTQRRAATSTTPAADRIDERITHFVPESAGRRDRLPLPYRDQAKALIPTEEELRGVPPGVCREMVLRGRMTRSVVNVSEPLGHASLGLAAYVQISSPIRRYNDLLAHWQLKVRLRCACASH